MVAVAVSSTGTGTTIRRVAVAVALQNRTVAPGRCFLIQNTVFCSCFLLKHHENLGFQLFLDQFCEDQAYNSCEEILQNKKQKQKDNEKRTTINV